MVSPAAFRGPTDTDTHLAQLLAAGEGGKEEYELFCEN
jgi:hypothetical protein